MRNLLAALFCCLPFTVLAQTVEPGPLAQREVTTTVACEWPEYLDYTAHSGHVYRYPAPAFDTGCDVATEPADPGHTDPTDPHEPPPDTTGWVEPPVIETTQQIVVDATTSGLPENIIEGCLVENTECVIDGVTLMPEAEWPRIRVAVNSRLRCINGGGLAGTPRDSVLRFVEFSRMVEIVGCDIAGQRPDGTFRAGQAAVLFAPWPDKVPEGNPPAYFVIRDSIIHDAAGNGVLPGQLAAGVVDPVVWVINSRFEANGAVKFSNGATHHIYATGTASPWRLFVRDTVFGGLCGDGNMIRSHGPVTQLLYNDFDFRVGRCGTGSKALDMSPNAGHLALIGNIFVQTPGVLNRNMIRLPVNGTAELWSNKFYSSHGNGRLFIEEGGDLFGNTLIDSDTEAFGFVCITDGCNDDTLPWSAETRARLLQPLGELPAVE